MDKFVSKVMKELEFEAETYNIPIIRESERQLLFKQTEKNFGNRYGNRIFRIAYGYGKR